LVTEANVPHVPSVSKGNGSARVGYRFAVDLFKRVFYTSV
jgi:hypothetical protein